MSNENSLLRASHLELVEYFKPGVALCKAAEEFIVYKEPREENEYEVASLVNNIITEGYNSKFKTLRLPEFLTLERKDNYLTMQYCGDNTDIVKAWEIEGGGGSGLKLLLSSEMAEIINDFSIIPVEKNHQLKRLIPDLVKMRESFLSNLEVILKEGFLSIAEADKAKMLIKEEDKHSHLFIFNNGDYYPRNLVPAGDKVFVVDWQGWERNYRANTVDTVENVAAFAYIHMWKNVAWQKNFIKNLRKYFSLRQEALRIAILFKSLDQFIFFNKLTGPAQEELKIFRNFLDDNYVNIFWSETKPNYWELFHQLVFSIRRRIPRMNII